MEDKKVAEMKMEIADYLRKKDYYDLLGVPKTAEEPQIKKAFKRLALRFHPDKNAIEGSKDVFKKLANAYSTLTDADKRAHYDRFGPDEQIQQAQAQAYAYQAQQENGFDFQLPEDIFMHVLFGGQRPQQFRQRRHQQQQYYQEAHARPQTNINVLYIIGFLVVMSIISSLFETKPYHSMAKTDVYRYQIFTDVLKVPFFVREEYFPAAKELKFKRKIFEAVDFSFISQLNQSCDQASWTKKSFEKKALTYPPGPTKDSYLFKANQVDQSSCSNLIQIRARHKDYINRLFSY